VRKRLAKDTRENGDSPLVAESRSRADKIQRRPDSPQSQWGLRERILDRYWAIERRRRKNARGGRGKGV